MDALNEVLNYFSGNLKNLLVSTIKMYNLEVNEICLRANNYLALIAGNTTTFLKKQNSNELYIVDKEELENIFLNMCDNSVYSHMFSMKEGYITLRCGARVGICSTAVYDNNNIATVKNVSSINIRIPKEAKGCSLEVLNKLFLKNIPSVIVAGAPSSGKTTLLRDMAYQLSNGFNNKFEKVTVIDERNEFAGKCNCEFTLSVGANCDVLTYFKKEKGIEIAIRTLSPKIIFCDEISSISQLEQIKFGFNSGVSFAVSVHVSSKDKLFSKELIKKLISLKEFSYILYIEQETYQVSIIEI